MHLQKLCRMEVFIKQQFPPPPSRMRYVAAYLLAVLGGKSNPSKEQVEAILESVGLDVDDERLSKVRCD